MKRIILVRHGKAEHRNYERDFLRVLTERGESDAKKLSAELKRLGYTFDFIISSPATRALTTAQIYAATNDYPLDKIREEKDLYFDFTTYEFINFIETLDNSLESVAVFGHNPFMAYLSGNLSKLFSGDMPTCSTVVIEFDVDNWNEIEARGGEVVLQLMPRMFKSE